MKEGAIRTVLMLILRPFPASSPAGLERYFALVFLKSVCFAPAPAPDLAARAGKSPSVFEFIVWLEGDVLLASAPLCIVVCGVGLLEFRAASDGPPASSSLGPLVRRSLTDVSTGIVATSQRAGAMIPC